MKNNLLTIFLMALVGTNIFVLVMNTSTIETTNKKVTAQTNAIYNIKTECECDLGTPALEIKRKDNVKMDELQKVAKLAKELEEALNEAREREDISNITLSYVNATNTIDIHLMSWDKTIKQYADDYGCEAEEKVFNEKFKYEQSFVLDGTRFFDLSNSTIKEAE